MFISYVPTDSLKHWSTSVINYGEPMQNKTEQCFLATLSIIPLYIKTMKTLVLTFPSILLSNVYQRIGSGQLNNMPLCNTAPENQYLNLSLKTSGSGPYYILLQ